MGRYSSRHSARHAAPRVRRSPRIPSGALPRGLASRPAALSLAIVAAAMTMAVSAEPGGSPETVTLTLSDTAVVQSVESTAMVTQDIARLGVERADLNAERGVVRAKIAADEKAQAELLARQRAEAQERAAREAERKAAQERRAAALGLEAAQQDPMRAAQVLMPDYGFTGDRQWQCLHSLWMGESDWSWSAENPSSGAYGIPQSLPAGKMASAGDDWRTNPVTQIRWGLEYITLSYGTPCGAWEFWQAQNPHWY